MGIERMFKKVAITAIIGISLALVPPAHSATEPAKPTSVPGCKKSVAKGHTPARVTQPLKTNKATQKKLTLTTNCGNIEITLNPKAPQTVTNMSALANAKYFNASLCHRLTTEGLYVLQCGDPTATGSGSPTGWTGYADENLPKAGTNNYPAGTVAMANSGPGTNGSQFFLVYANTTLGPNYTIWGRITKGLDLVKKIAEVGAYKVQNNQAYYAGDGFPIQLVEIIKASAK
jgi:peptidyl-prolyl cis-trans isomerase B (cyclophilin B)